MTEKYVKVTFPETQNFMDHPRWSECIFCMEIQDHPCEDSTFMIPESLYNEIMEQQCKILFIDLDGTLINTFSGETFPRGIWDMEFRFDVWDKIKELNPKCIFIVSNQGGIEKGFVNEDKFITKMDYIANALSEYTGIENVYYDFCTTNNKNDRYRKPNPGILEEISENSIHAKKYGKHEMLMIGDASGKPGQFSDSDKKCAENFGIDYIDVEDFLET